MHDVFTQHPNLVVPTVSVLCGSVVAVVWILCYYWSASRQAQLEVDLKRDMLTREMSAEDIERVLRASSDSSPEEEPGAPDPISDNQYALVEKMIDEGKSTEDIERLIRAFKDPAGAPDARVTTF
jgi:hypothetical protein